jgi:hypothetical protein
MFNNQNIVNTETSSVRKFYTGLTQIKIVAINPTLDQLSDLIGEDIAKKFDTNYSMSEFNGVDTRPIVFWVTDLDENISPTPVQISISKDDVVSRAGNAQFINDYLQSTYSANLDTLMNNERMSWFSKTGIKNARIGEVQFYDILTKCLKMNTKEGNAIEVLRTENLDFDSVLNGNYDGLRNLVNYLPTIDSYPISLAAVKEAVDDEGKTRLRQKFSFYQDTFFKADEVSNWHTNRIMEKHLDAVERQSSLVKDYFTVDFQVYDKTKCVNYEEAPSETMSQSSSDEPSWLRH